MEDVAVLSNVEKELSLAPPVKCPLKHIFTPGMYMRRIEMPAFTEVDGEQLQTVVLSQRHKTTHPYIVSRGKLAVFNDADGFLGIIEAPYDGVTIAGTCRLLRIIEDTVWCTFHALDFIQGDENTWPQEQQDELVAMIEELLVGKQVCSQFK